MSECMQVDYVSPLRSEKRFDREISGSYQRKKVMRVTQLVADVQRGGNCQRLANYLRRKQRS